MSRVTRVRMTHGTRRTSSSSLRTGAATGSAGSPANACARCASDSACQAASQRSDSARVKPVHAVCAAPAAARATTGVASRSRWPTPCPAWNQRMCVRGGVSASSSASMAVAVCEGRRALDPRGCRGGCAHGYSTSVARGCVILRSSVGSN